MSKKVDKKSRDQGMQSLRQVLFDYAVEDKGGRITKEFQDYGYRLAVELNDLKSKSLYIKLAKEVARPMLEKARAFVLDSKNARHKGRLFIWALKKLKKGEPLYEPYVEGGKPDEKKSS